MGGTGLCGAGNERKRTGPEAGRLGTAACAPCGERGPCVVTAVPALHAAALGSVWMDVLSFPKGLVSSQRPLPASPPTSLPRDPEFTHSLTRSLAHPFAYLRFFLCAGHSEGRPRLPSHHRISRVLTRWRVGFPRRRPQLLLGAHGPWCRLCIHWTLYSPLRWSPRAARFLGPPGARQEPGRPFLHHLPPCFASGSLRACPQPWAFTWEVAKPDLTFLLLKEKPAELDGAATRVEGAWRGRAWKARRASCWTPSASPPTG